MKRFAQEIGICCLLFLVSVTPTFSQQTGAAASSNGLTTAELRALNSEGNPKKRAENAIKLANAKAEDARKHALKGNSAETETAANGFDAALGHAWGNIEQAESQGADMTNAVVKVSEATAKHNAKLSEVLNRVPDQAKPHLEHAMEVSRRGHDHALNALESAAARQSSDPQRRARLLLDVADGRATQIRETTARGDAAGTRRAAQAYEKALNGALDSVNTGQQQGRDMESIMNEVAQATARHQGALEDVGGRVPVDAKAAIDRAMEVSQKGHDTALAKLEQARGQHTPAERGGYGSDAGRGSMGAGAGSSMGRPTGMGGGSGSSGGPPAGVGGGRR